MYNILYAYICLILSPPPPNQNRLNRKWSLSSVYRTKLWDGNNGFEREGVGEQGGKHSRWEWGKRSTGDPFIHYMEKKHVEMGMKERELEMRKSELELEREKFEMKEERRKGLEMDTLEKTKLMEVYWTITSAWETLMLNQLFDSTIELNNDQSCQYVPLSVSIGTRKSSLSKASVPLDTSKVVEMCGIFGNFLGMGAKFGCSFLWLAPLIGLSSKS